MINKFKEKIKSITSNTKESPILAPTDMLSNITFKIGYIDIVLEAGININIVKSKLKTLKRNYLLFSFDSGNDDSIQLINDYTFNNVFIHRSYIYIYRKKECNMHFCFNLNIRDNLSEKIEQVLNTIEGLKLLSNYNATNNISVKTSTFFGYDGTNYYSGGGERYLIDLHQVCEELGLNLNIFQHGTKPFFRKYKNINVIGLKSDLPIGYDYQFIDRQSKNYIYHTYNNTKLHIYSAFQECYPNHIGPSIGISHGISWDNRGNHYSDGKDCFWENKKRYLDGAAYCHKLISVDTNTPNWFQTIDFEMGNQKFHVIPNYVDINEFKPRKDFLKPKEKIIITYPRRLYEPRGLYLVLNIVDKILDTFENVEFHFVGKGFDKDLKNIEDKIKKYPNRIKCYSKKPEEMKEIYAQSDISLIPTLYSEGTSLSCLEAMASGNLVIATRIGGLTDLVVNGHNGYLIEPNSTDLLNTLEKVLRNFNDQEQIRKNGIEVAKSFNKKIWQEKWKKEIEEFNIKEKSSNNDLIEIYIEDEQNIPSKLLKIIQQNLIKGNLIYLRLNLENEDKISHGLLQVVNNNEEIVSKAAKVYKQKEYNKKINRDEAIEVI